MSIYSNHSFARFTASTLFSDSHSTLSLSPSIVAFGAIAASVLYLLSEIIPRRRLVDKQGNQIPPGPWGLPIVGSFPFLTHYPELTLDHWAKVSARKFGNMYSIWLGNQLFVVVSDPRIIKDLMVTNGAIFSSRKEMFIKSQTIFKGRGITDAFFFSGCFLATPYSERWRKHRRIAWSWLHQRAVDGYTPVLDREATSMIKNLYIASQAGAVPINPQVRNLAHSESVGDNLWMGTCEWVVLASRRALFPEQHADHRVRDPHGQPGPSPRRTGSQIEPRIHHLPTRMRARGRKLHKELIETYGGMVKNIEAQVKDGVPVPDCAAKTMVESREKEGLDDMDMAILASAFMIGGVETTAGILQWFSALIPAFPEVQRKAQEELDRVVGRDRLPTVEDEKNLPYCRAIIKEVARVHNPFWLGTPHAVTEDFTYNGQFIPKDTVVICNTYTMHFDERRHPEPLTFNPDRYIDDTLSSAESANLSDPYQRDHWMFGVGRRICAGKIVAEREIWLTISRMLWAFEMRQVPGEPIDLKEYDGQSGRSPVPFRIRIAPRHDKVVEVLDKFEL
ncbi:hypothetical protein EW146_g5914 [Bondarzewia mesenterica]|uniref:Cytochrome P450 n=1 Tax=Bondarzewia mesenterica TaxID=1095465 RepID=A0A4V3XEP8_9AGAM|nr:hypothetical protein EW146_g5914 [Bondarzewia mesenterica]